MINLAGSFIASSLFRNSLFNSEEMDKYQPQQEYITETYEKQVNQPFAGGYDHPQTQSYERQAKNPYYDPDFGNIEGADTGGGFGSHMRNIGLKGFMQHSHQQTGGVFGALKNAFFGGD